MCPDEAVALLFPLHLLLSPGRCCQCGVCWAAVHVAAVGEEVVGYTISPSHATMQDCLRKVVKGVGGFGHAQWRAFQNEHSRAECKGFVDGDLIEQVMHSAAQACMNVTMPVQGKEALFTVGFIRICGQCPILWVLHNRQYKMRWHLLSRLTPDKPADRPAVAARSSWT